MSYKIYENILPCLYGNCELRCENIQTIYPLKQRASEKKTL